MFSQRELRVELASRVSRVEGMEQGPPAAAVAVLRSFDPVAFARSVLEFAVASPEESRGLWLANYTRTLFLAGNPDNLVSRYPLAVVSGDGSVGWYAAAPTASFKGLRLLLRALRGELPLDMPSGGVVTVPGRAEPGVVGAREWRLEVDVRGLSLPQYLVHVSHTLAEALLLGVLRSGDRIALTHTESLPRPPFRPGYLRVHRDDADPDLLRAYACLWTESESGSEWGPASGPGPALAR